MWVCLTDAFFSIVHKDCKADEVLVRARRPGDIEKVFDSAKVIVLDKSDYRFRAVVKTEEVAQAIATEVRRIDYGNFKSAVQDNPLHNAYLRVWSAMMDLQPRPPQPTRRLPAFFDFDDALDPDQYPSPVKRKAMKRKPAKLKGRGR